MNYNDDDNYEYSEEQNNSLKNKVSTGIKDFISGKTKELISSMPLGLKIKIMSGVVIAALFLIIIIYIASMPYNFLNTFDNSTPETYEEQFNNYWGELCVEEDQNCTNEAAEYNTEIIKSQKKFFNRYDSLSKHYNLGTKQKYILLSTAFFGYDIENFTEDNGAFVIDDNDNYSDEIDNETDTLKSLVKAFYTYTVNCEYSNGEKKEIALDTGVFSVGFKESIAYLLTGTIDKIGFNEAKKACEAENGVIRITKASDATASETAFYDYLLNADYLDNKPTTESYYTKYGTTIGKNPVNFTEDEKRQVRQIIIEEIKEIVDNQMSNLTDESRGVLLVSSGYINSNYWWPIGSDETSIENGVTTAKGEPAFKIINSYFGGRKCNSTVSCKHNGIDLHGINGSTNVIASISGTVTFTYNGCESTNSIGCGGGAGNYINIKDSFGNTTKYMHLAKNTITVSKGQQVIQGQVIGKVGNSGNSTGQHLHFGIMLAGSTNVDPLNYVSADNPRPIANVLGQDNKQTVCKYFKSYGYDDNAVAAIMKNIDSESSFQTVDTNELGCDGLVQWCFDRLNTLKSTYGSAWSDPINQLDFVRYELETTKKGVNEVLLSPNYSVVEKTNKFCMKYEIPGEKYCRPRVANADMFLQYSINGCQD